MRKYDQAANEHVVRYIRREISEAARSGASRETTAKMTETLHNEIAAGMVMICRETGKRY